MAFEGFDTSRWINILASKTFEEYQKMEQDSQFNRYLKNYISHGIPIPEEILFRRKLEKLKR
jgi:hypothetical protein